jgi:cyclomaltodextrinase
MPQTFQTPEWVHHAVFYQIFPDRFASSQQVIKPSNFERWDTPPTPYGFKGGDLVGVVEKLDYLQDLGVNAIYFTPIFSSASNHRYHTHDYMQVDPLLGGRPSFDLLLKEAHHRGIRIVLDGVFNHASRGFFQFNHILEVGPQSPYLDWFKVRGFPMHAYEGKPNYECWWSLAGLPTLNHANPQVQAFIYDVARYWLDQGIDGWRLDVPFEVKEEGFWQKFREVVKTANPDAYITGEIPWDATQWLQGDQFDGVMNYLMTYPCWSFFGGDRIDLDLVGHWRGHDENSFVKDATSFGRVVTSLLSKYPRPAILAQMNLLDSHDTARFLSITGSKAALRLATLFQMTYPGAPCIYYGNEIGMEGKKDPDCRRTFNWNESTWDNDLRTYFQNCIRLRMDHPALRDGEWKLLQAAEGVVVYMRSLDDDCVVVVLNNSNDSYHLDVQPGLDYTGPNLFVGAFTPGSAFVENGRLTGLTVSPMTGAALVKG